jgi:hypothetical protein
MHQGVIIHYVQNNNISICITYTTRTLTTVAAEAPGKAATAIPRRMAAEDDSFMMIVSRQW